MPATPPSDDPLYSGELRERANLTLAAILRALLVVLPVILVAGALGITGWAQLLALGVTLAYVAALYFLQRRGHFELCVHATVFGLIIFAALLAALYGSVRSAGTVGQVAAITIGGLFLRRKALLFAVALSIASLGALIYAENAAWLPVPNHAVTPSHWVFYSVIIAATALVLSYMRGIMIDVVRGQRSEIAQRQVAEAEQHHSETKYAAVFGSVPDPIAIARESDAVQLEANQAWFRITGYSREQAIGRSAVDLGLWVETEQREQVLAQLNDGGAVDNVPVRFRIANGLMIDALLSGIRVTLDGERCIVWSWREVTELRRIQVQERQMRAKFQGLFDISPEGIAVTRWKDAVLIEANDAALSQLGIARQDAVGRSVLDLGIGASAEDNATIFAQLRAQARVVNRSTRFRRYDGTWLEFLLCAATLTLDDEKCVVWSWRDVTEQRRAEEQRNQALQKFTTLFETNPAGLVLIRPRDDRIVEINDAALALIGVTRETALAKPSVEIIRWTAEEVRNEARPRVHAGNRVVDQPRQLRNHEGRVLDTLTSVTLIQIEGEPLVMITIRDVSAQLKQQRALAESEDRFEKAFHASQDAIAINRLADGRTVAVNRRMAELYGMPQEELVGKTTVELGMWTREQRRQMVEALKRERRITDQEIVFRNRRGKERICNYSAELLELDGELHAIGFLRDITEQKRAGEELRSNRRLLETVIDALPMPIFAKDVDSNYIMLNKRMAEFFGAPKEEILRLHTSRLPVPGATRSKSLDDDEWVFRNRRTLDQPDVFLAGSDGIQINFHSTKIPLFDDAGKMIGLLGINREIAEEKRAQAALRDSEHRYRSLFQAAMDCILVISPEGTIIDVNEFGCRSLGYTREELIGGTFARILDESKLSRLLPRPPGVKLERRTLRAEQEVRAKDGSTRAVEFTAGGLPDGNILVVARDVTERRRGEKLLENIAKGVSAQTGVDFFRTLVLALCRELPADTVFIGEAVGSGDRVRTIACCTDGALAENFDYALAGSPCVLAIERRGTVIHPRGVAAQFPEDEGLARRGIEGYAGTSLFDVSGKAIGILVALTRKPIERKEFFVSMLEIFAARAAGEIERARADATARELTISLERRVRERTAELEAANRDLDSFGYSVSHDLRAPLGALNGFAHLLRTREAERLSAEGVHLLRQLESNATRMTSLVEGLLEFSRLGRKPVTRVAVEMAALVSEVVEELRAENRSRHIDFRIGAIADAYGDPVLLLQVWRNLIGNAVKYTRGRDPAVIEIGSDPAAREYYVRDNGAGFDMQYAGRLFGVFERLHGESEFEGTGIGLAIVQRVVNRHGGAVRGEGRLDSGATFRFTLPSR